MKHNVETWNHKRGRLKAALTDVWGSTCGNPQGVTPKGISGVSVGDLQGEPQVDPQGNPRGNP